MASIGNARKARLSIPKVQNPNGSITAPRSVQGHGISPARPVSRPAPAPNGSTSATAASPALTQAAAGISSANFAPTSLGGSPRAPVNSPQVGTDPFATPAYSNPQGVDPRDASYWQNLAKLQFQDRTEYAANLAEQTKADSDYAAATQEALRNRVSNQRQIGESTLANGLADSGYHDRIGTEATTQYNADRAHAELSKSQEDAARKATRDALVQGYSIETAAMIGEAAARYAEGHVAQAEEGGPELGAPAPAAGAQQTNQHPVGAKRLAAAIKRAQKGNKK